MYFFFIKKVFFDAWDNLLSLILLNFGFILIIAGFAYSSILFEPGGIPFFISWIVLIFLFNFYSGGVAGYTKELIYSGNAEIKDIPIIAAKTWKQNTVLSAVTVFEAATIFIGFPFYLSIGGIPGLAGAVTIFWVTVFWSLSSQFYFPAGFQLAGGVKKQIKKSFMIFLDNTGFSIFLGIHTLILLAVSFLTAFLIPGISIIILSHQIALKLRLYKYEFLEENPGTKNRNIPWEALLLEEKDRLGNRTLKGMIFPWRD